MRIRTIKPAFWKSLSIAALPVRTRLHFIGLWNYADDAGRGVDDTRLLKAELWPLDVQVGLKAVEQMQRDLASSGRIVRYMIAGRAYFEIANWTEHQRLDHPQESLIPSAESPEASLFDPRSFDEPSRNGAGQLPGEGKGREGNRKGRDSSAAPRATRERDGRFDELARAVGEEPTELTATAAKRIGTALAEIRHVDPEVTPEEIARRAANYPSHFPDAALTAHALSSHWARCGKPAGHRQSASDERFARIARDSGAA